MRDSDRYFICNCCELLHPVRERSSPYNDGAVQTECGPCIEHRGADDQMRLRRAEEHEAEYRRRYTGAREAANNAEEQRNGAFKSRNHAVRKLERLRDLHESAGTRRVCTCGVKDCKTLESLEDPWLTDRINDLRARERRAWEPDDEDWEPYGITAPCGHSNTGDLPRRSA